MGVVYHWTHLGCRLHANCKAKPVVKWFPHLSHIFHDSFQSGPPPLIPLLIIISWGMVRPRILCVFASFPQLKVDMCYLDTFLFAPTSCRIWNTQFTQNNQQMNRAHNMSFIHVYFWCFFRSSPNHIPLKYRCPYYWCVGFGHIHLSHTGLIEDIKCSVQCGQMVQTSLNKSQYRLYLKHYSGFSWTSLFYFSYAHPIDTWASSITN